VSHINVVRAWKDEEYRRNLSEAERAALPDNPAGLLDVVEAELQQVGGGFVVPPTPILYYTLNRFACPHPYLTLVAW
jgi:mersacidin/lichenicidin family type 2 lantibiotic